MNVPENLHYSPSHEWLRLEGSTGTVGITDHAQAELTDVVYVELPQIGAKATAGQQICVVESVKAASDIYSPISGTITEVNTALSSNPALINTAPFAEGWIFKLTADSPAEASALKTPAQYRDQLSQA